MLIHLFAGVRDSFSKWTRVTRCDQRARRNAVTRRGLSFETLEDRYLLSTFLVNHTPYLQLGNAPLPGFAGSATDRIQIIWQTMPASGTGNDSFVVEYRHAGAPTWIDAGPSSIINTGVSNRVNRFVDVTGLDYDADYEYRVRHLRDGAVVNDYQTTFHTRLPTGSSQPFTFVSYGDSAKGNPPTGFINVQNRINTITSSFSVLLGDNVYESGTHAELDLRFDPTINAPTPAYNKNHVEYYTLGNHDVATAGGQPSRDNYAVPIPVAGVTSSVNGPSGAPAENNYSFDFGNVHFTTFDSNGGVSTAEANWVLADMQASTAKWKVVFYHHYMYDTAPPADTFANQLRAAGVDLLLCGHRHSYGRDVSGSQFSEGNQLIEVISGAGGESNSSSDGFLKIDVTAPKLTVSQIRASDGATVDSFSINSTSTGSAPTNIALSANTVAENAANNTVVGTITTTDPDAGDTHTYTLTNNAGGRFGISGNQLVVANGSLLDFETSTSHSVAILSTDSAGLSFSKNFTINVTNVNEAPTANSNAYSVTRGATLNANDTTGSVGGTNDDSVLVNDTDPESNSLTATTLTNPTHGTLTLNANGTFTYTHNNDSATSDSFTYRVSDGTNQSNLATVTLTINPGGGATTTVSLQDGVNGYAGTIDTTIQANSPTSATGLSATTIEAYDTPDKASLLRWELPAGLTGSIVQSASITLWITNTTTINYGLYELLRSWTESDATWNQYAAGTPWGTAGAQQINVDRAATVLASLTSPNTGFVTINLNSDGIALVQKWINTPSTNHGITIQYYVTTTGNGVGFDSSEAQTATNRPKLTFTYSTGSPVNNPPTITTTASALSYTENNPATAIDPGLTTSDPNSANYVGATVSITGGFALGQDVLGFANQNGISGAYNAATGVLTLSGTSSVATYQTALRSVTYVNTSENPSTSNRTVRFSVNDGALTGSANRTISVTPLNDAPTANGNSYSVNRGATLNANDATGTVGLNNDSVLVNDTDPENNALTAVKVTDPTHGTLTLNANGTFTYTHNNDSATSDSFTYRASDGPNQSNIATVTITIGPNGGTTTVSLQDGVNGYTGTLDTTIQANSPTSATGLSATTIEAYDTPDKASLLRWELPSSLAGSIVQSAAITLWVTNTTTITYQLYELLRSWTEGGATWNQYAAGTPWGAAGAQQINVDRAAAVLASLTSPNTGFVTINLNSDGIALVQKWINTPSTNHGVTIQNYSTATGNGVGFDSSEAQTSANRPKLTITYATGGPINNPPTITTTVAALSYTENIPATAIDPALLTSDQDSANYVGATVAITGGFASGQDALGFANQNGISGTYNATSGVLTLSGASSPGNYQSALRSVTYVNTSENPSTSNRTVMFSVNDGALTGSATRTISVTPVNDAPTANSNAYSVSRGATLNANDATGTVGGTNDNSVVVNDTDPENNALSAILVAGPTHASGFTLNPNGTFTYTHNNDSATSDSFTYRASDGPNQSNIGTVTITINPSGGTTTTVSLQDGVNGYTGTIDTTIKASFPNATTGASAASVEALDDPDRGPLLRWELPSIPMGSIVQSASITVWVTNRSTGTYDLYELLRSWTEGSATWNQYAAGAAWGAVGAQQIGVDRGAAVLASFAPPTTGFVTINLNSDGIAMVQKWINTPSTNHGVTIQNYATTTSDVFAFDSSEATTAANRPKLTITYGSGSSLMAAATMSVTNSPQTGSTLTDAALARIGQDATARWLTIAPAEMHNAIRTAASSITFAISDLPGQTLGTSFGNTILIDRDAAGFGWFIDRTPRDDREFDATHNASPTSPAFGHMDLLSVVAHELGHLLGFDHDSARDVMRDSLEAGHRTIAVDEFFQGVGSHHSGSAYGELNPFQ